MTYTMPESLRAYFSDEPAVARAVDALATDLAGKKCPEQTFEYIREYNRALLMAATVRADFIDMLFELWSRSFGVAGAVEHLDAEFFDTPPDEASPKGMWETSQLNRHFHLSQADGIVCLTITGDREAKEIYLELWIDDGDIDLETLHRASWKIESSDEADYLQSSPVAISKLINDPQSAIEELRVCANTLIDALRTYRA